MVPKAKRRSGAPGTGIGSARVDLGRVAGTTGSGDVIDIGCSIRVCIARAVHDCSARPAMLPGRSDQAPPSGTAVYRLRVFA